MNVGPNHAVEKEIGKVMTAETESRIAPWSVPLGKMDKEHLIRQIRTDSMVKVAKGTVISEVTTQSNGSFQNQGDLQRLK